LLGLWRARFFEHAAFYGGTALRILHGLDRFSEDLDFSLLAPTPDFSLQRFSAALEEEVRAFGFNLRVEAVDKAVETAVQSAGISLMSHPLRRPRRRVTPVARA
jgi:predicted nucleotidyltransferase component of viral defense system